MGKRDVAAITPSRHLCRRQGLELSERLRQFRPLGLFGNCTDRSESPLAEQQQRAPGGYEALLLFLTEKRDILDLY